MARFYANENFPLQVVHALRGLGHDVLTTQDTGQSGKASSDESVLAFAYHEGRMLLTFNRKHFIRLHLAGTKHCGIVACTVDTGFHGLASRIHEAVQGQDPKTKPLIRVNRPSH